MSWKYIGAHNISFLIDGVDVFKEHWNRTNRKVKVKDPRYGQSYTFDVYYVHVENRDVYFASGEFSASVFGFYIEQPMDV